MPLVGAGIGIFRCAQEREAHEVAVGGMTIFAIVEQRDAVIRFGQVRPFVGVHFKARDIPTGVVMRGALDVSELDFVGRILRAEVQRELHF